MSDWAQETWTAMDGSLVFDFALDVQRRGEAPSIVRIYWLSRPRDVRVVSIFEQYAIDLNFVFESGGYVKGSLQQKMPVHIEGVSNLAVFGDLRYGLSGKHEEHHFEGVMVACPVDWTPPPDPEPKPIPDPEPDPDRPPYDDIVVNEAQPGELFPYVYVRKWPNVTPQDLARSFIQYVPEPASPPAADLYQALLLARQQGRDAMQDAALGFINGSAPYQGQFVPCAHGLSGEIGQFPYIAQALGHPGLDWVQLAARLLTVFPGGVPTIQAYLVSGAYTAQLEQVWQSYFALMVILDYDLSDLYSLAGVLQVAHLLEVLFESASPPTSVLAEEVEIAPEAPAESDDPDVVQALPVAGVATPNPLLSCCVRQDLLHQLADASIILPSGVFPLPPAGSVASPPVSTAKQDGWIEPYAIGDLQMVHQRLLRYRMGEIAHIENVMQGERREISRKCLSRQTSSLSSDIDDLSELGVFSSDDRQGLREQANRTITEKSVANVYSKFNTSYGPPTQATLDGSWTESTTQGSAPGVDDVTRFARDVLSKTVSRINHNIHIHRSSSTLDQTEDAVISVIDNTRADRSLVCVYRWLNKVYEAWVVNYGHRLILEFMIVKPAAEFIGEEQALSGISLVRPPTLGSFGVHSFQSVSRTNYARLAAIYGVTEIDPPPDALRYVSATLRGGEEQQIAIPSGYQAFDASVNCIAYPDAGAAVSVLVGSQLFKPGDPPQTGRRFGEDQAIPVSVIGEVVTLSPPSAESLLVNVEVACKPSDSLMSAWQIKTYAALLQGYQAQLARYLGSESSEAGRRPTRSALACRDIEQATLRRACQRMLMELLAVKVGTEADQSPPAFSVNEPRYLQFFDEALEWAEMSYVFYMSPSGKRVSLPAGFGMATDERFSAFLSADSARLMLPVAPGRTLALLYFLSSGLIWQGSDRLAPVDACDVALVNDLKSSSLHRHVPVQRVGKPWELVVPTAMQVLDDATINGDGRFSA